MVNRLYFRRPEGRNSEREGWHACESQSKLCGGHGGNKKAHLSPKDFQNRSPLGIQVGREMSSKKGPSKPKQHPIDQ